MAEEPSVLLPVIVTGEYRYGLLSSRERVEREARFKGFCRACSLLSVDEETAGHYAAVRHRLRLAGTPIPENDIWIAALCLQHGQRILSNDRHFDLVQGVTRIGWWECSHVRAPLAATGEGEGVIAQCRALD